MDVDHNQLPYQFSYLQFGSCILHADVRMNQLAHNLSKLSIKTTCGKKLLSIKVFAIVISTNYDYLNKNNKIQQKLVDMRQTLLNCNNKS